MSDRQIESEKYWTKVVSKKQRRDYSLSYDSKVKVIKHYWDGFNDKGEEQWYIELSNGVLISNTDKEYNFWVKRCYPNR